MQHLTVKDYSEPLGRHKLLYDDISKIDKKYLDKDISCSMSCCPNDLPYIITEYNPTCVLKDLKEKWMYVTSSTKDIHPSGIYILDDYLVLLTKEHPLRGNINHTDYYMRYLYEGENIHDENLWTFNVYCLHTLKVHDSRNYNSKMGSYTKKKFIQDLGYTFYPWHSHLVRWFHRKRRIYMFGSVTF